MNIPNMSILLRIFLAVIVFTLIGLQHYDIALFVFLLVLAADLLDGWRARRYKKITVFSRIMDPFASNFLICGVFVCLVAIPELTSDKAGYPVWLMLQVWMVIVIIGRELLVSSLRAFIEGAGGDFSAKWIGKCKVVLQCAAIILALLYLSGGAEWDIASSDGHELLVQEFYRPDLAAQKGTILAQGLDQTFGTKTWRTVTFFMMLSAFWLSIGLTLLSGLDYSIHATRTIRKQRERQAELEARRRSLEEQQSGKATHTTS
jgi:CDP-diacylglycerol--glycerol-3-phosphate 3-phosphatidyltransferase